MGNIAVIMPIIGAIGFIVIVAIILVIRSKEKQERIKIVDAATFKSFAEEMKREDYINVFDALSHPARIKIIGILAEGRQYVSELARLVNISRPLLYMHLKKLETARLVTSAMEISESGKAMKYYALEDFELQITKELLNELSQNIIIETPSKDGD